VTLPKYFKESKYTSFTRKLNRWGFSRVTRGPEAGAYYHPYFQRGNLRRTLLMTCMQRTSSKKNKPEESPNQAMNEDSAATARILGFGSAPEQLGGGGGADPLAVARLMQQLEQANSGHAHEQRNQQIIEQARNELLLRQEQEKLAQLEELRNGQQENLHAFSQYHNLLARMEGSPGASNNPFLTGSAAQGIGLHQNLLAHLGASSSLRESMLSGSSTAAGNPLSGASTLGSPTRNGLPSASLESSFASNQQAAILEAAMALQRTDPAAYLAMLVAAKQKNQSQANSLEQPPTQEALLLRAQQQNLNEFLQQQQQRAASQGNSIGTQHQSQSLPPKKR